MELRCWSCEGKAGGRGHRKYAAAPPEQELYRQKPGFIVED